MASTLSKSSYSAAIFPSSFFFFFLFSNVAVSSKSYRFSETTETESMGLKREKITHLHFYFHDILSGRNPTAIQIVKPPAYKSSLATGFGAVFVIDDPLTETPEVTSKLVGRAEGIYASTSKEELGLLMVLNYAFMEGKYNGSTLSILGRNTVFSTVREMPVVGGTGLFRFARGYAHAKTHRIDLKTGDAVVEYNVFVIHY
uniref:Dirigent protein n=1 Tax=Nelumbo nucifera TaxID=4432 RepID=A0A822Z6Z7_NELNU|nr:TPA_asm: hypothetical protein HUJ06_000374 [Nelumbo nucifera]